MRFRTILPALTVILLVIAACGDDDSGDAPTSATTQAATGSEATTAPAAGGGASGFVTIGDETIAFDSVRCYLQPQDAAAGGGRILATGQGFGTNAAGDEVALDFTRFSEDSQFAGDDVSVTVGDPFSESSTEFLVGLDLGAVDMSGSTLSASGFSFQNYDDGTAPSGAFELNC